MMTLYIVFEAIEADQLAESRPVLVSGQATSAPGRRIGLAAGREVDLGFLIHGLAANSAADAAIALAEATAGSERAFVGRMNATASRLGMSGTRFVNSHGAPAAGQRTTARDMAILAMRIFQDFPERRAAFVPDEADRRARRILSQFDVSEASTGASEIGPSQRQGPFNSLAAPLVDGVRMIVAVMGADQPEEGDIRVARLIEDLKAQAS